MSRVYNLKHATPRMKYVHMNMVLAWKADLQQHQANEAARKQLAKTRDVCQAIRDQLTQAKYDAWWKSAPEDGFFNVACDKLLSLMNH